MNVDIFVENVKLRCRIRGVSPSKACRDSGAGDTLLDNIKRGRSPSIDRVELLAKYLDCTICELLGEESSGSLESPPQPYLVARYNSFPPEVQREVMAFIEFKVTQLAEKEAAEKKGK